MGPDFNDDGRVDGYDMEYLSGSGSGGGDAGCRDVLKLGCLVPIGAVMACGFVLTCLLYACSALSGT